MQEKLIKLGQRTPNIYRVQAKGFTKYIILGMIAGLFIIGRALVQENKDKGYIP